VIQARTIYSLGVSNVTLGVALTRWACILDGMTTIDNTNSATTDARLAVIREVRAEMARAGINASQLAELTNRNQQFWSRRFTGEIAFDIDNLSAIAAVLNVPMWRFMPVERPGADDPRGIRYFESPLSDSNRRPPLYIVGGSLDDAQWPAAEPKLKPAA
jgi:transcriptional regulator with XRE-family HTH domain